jgi:hypothetical protein
MPEPTIKSRPVYARLSRDAGARWRLLLADAPDAAPKGLASGTTLADFDERWTIVSSSRAIPSPEAGAADQSFRSLQHLLLALRRRLSEERMGLRLYAVGAEPFLWTVHAMADDFGMSRGEIHLCAAAPAGRRVFCNHCRTISEGVTTTVFACHGCKAPLLVRDHFSRRLNAFAGVQVDAEAPGDLPEIEALPEVGDVRA